MIIHEGGKKFKSREGQPSVQSTTGPGSASVSTSLVLTAIPVSSKLKVRDGGTWKEAKAVYVRDGGTWKEAKAIYARDSGNWKESK